METSISSSKRSLMIILKSWLVSVVSSLNSFYRPVVMTERGRECGTVCLAGREVQDKLRPPSSLLPPPPGLTPGHVPTVPGASSGSQPCLHSSQDTTSRTDWLTVLSDHYFSQINSSGREGRGGVRGAECKAISLPGLDVRFVRQKTSMAMVEVFSQNFPLVTRGQFSSQIIIAGRYWRYLQTWHLPPPHIIFPCNKSGFPAPGPGGGFVTTGHNYHHLVATSMPLLSARTSQPAALDWEFWWGTSIFPMFAAKVVMAETTQGSQYQNFVIFIHFLFTYSRSACGPG